MGGPDPWKITQNPVLDGSNYVSWCEFFEIYLGLLKLKKVLKPGWDPDAKPDEDEEALDHLKSLVDSEIRMQLKECKTFMEAWEYLKSSCAVTGLAKQSLIKQEMEQLKLAACENVHTYLSKLKTLKQQLIGAGGSISEQDLIILIFRAVGDKFQHIIGSIKTCSQKGVQFTFQEVQNLLVQEELEDNNKVQQAQLHLAQLNLAVADAYKHPDKPIKDRSNITCFACGKKGHFRNRCPEFKQWLESTKTGTSTSTSTPTHHVFSGSAVLSPLFSHEYLGLAITGNLEDLSLPYEDEITPLYLSAIPDIENTFEKIFEQHIHLDLTVTTADDEQFLSHAPELPLVFGTSNVNVATHSGIPSPFLMLDSGASKHLIGDESLLLNSEIDQSLQVTVSNGNSCQSYSKREIHLKSNDGLYTMDPQPLSYAISFIATDMTSRFVHTGGQAIGMADAVIQKKKTLNKLTMLLIEHLQQIVSSLQTEEENTLQLYSILKLLSSAFSTSLEGDAPRAWMKAFKLSIMAVADVICDISRSSSPVICLSIANFLHLKNSYFLKMDEIKTVLPMGAMQNYASKVSKALINDVDVSQNRLVALIDLLETLRRDTFDTPVLVWNDKKTIELQKFLQSEVDAFSAESKANRSLINNYVDSKLLYSPTSEGGASIVSGVHLELLVDDHLHHNSLDFFWKLWDPLPVFQSIFHALVLSFTTLFGHNNFPELDPWLAVHALTWICERHSTEVSFTFDTLNVIETAVGMFRELFENPDAFKCDAWSPRNSSGAVETVTVLDINGEFRLVRVPSGRSREVLGKAVMDGSMDAKDTIKWQDGRVSSTGIG